MDRETTSKVLSRGYYICILSVVAVFMIMWLVWVGPIPIRKKVQTVRTLICLQNALCEYGRLYGAYPTGCGDITNLVAILGGENPEGQNSKGVVFFRPCFQKAHSGGPYCDGWRHPLLVIKDTDGTNMVIRSAGWNGRDEGGRGDDLEFNTGSIGNPQ